MAGECSDREQKIIEQWINEDPGNKKGMEEFKRIWKASEQERDSKDAFEVDGEWDKLKARLIRDEELQYETEQHASHIRQFQTSSVHSTTQKVGRVAAILLVAGLFGLLFYQYWPQQEVEPQEQVLRTISTEKAQRANLTLGDGTKVLLNADSQMELPSEFAADVREVFLEGEAYFDVASNPERPFVIHSEGSIIRVLGTSFSVRSYPEDEQVRVVVKEGRVSLEAENQESPQEAVLTANELGRYSLKSNRIETHQVDDMQLYLSWREGYLKYKNTEMSKVAIELERRYGVEVTFEDAKIQKQLLTALLKSRSIRNVLDVISMSLNIEYQLKDNNVTFYR